jgi:hypothetical protein
MGWNYTYSPAGSSWTLTVYDRPGSDAINIVEKATPTGQRLGFAMNGAVVLGPTLATGSSGQIVLYKNAGDNSVVNTTPVSMTTLARTTSQSGTTVGLNWRYTYDYASNLGTLSVQDRPGLSPTFPSGLLPLLAVSADLRRAATTDAQRGTKVWDIASGRALASLPESRVVAALSPDGQSLAALDRTGRSITVWEVGTSRAGPTGTTQGSRALQFSNAAARWTSDGKAVILGG